MFEKLGATHGFDVAIRIGAHDAGTDFVLSNKANRTVGVEVKGRVRLREFAAAVRVLRASSWDQKMLVVDSSFPKEFADPFRAEGVWIVGWESDSEAKFVAMLHQMEFIDG